MNESVKSIAAWHAETFPDATFAGQHEKFIDEMHEWQASGKRDVLELADMFIVAAGMARFSTMAAMLALGIVFAELENHFSKRDLQLAIDRKMKINRARKWNFADGKYQHKGE